MPTFPPVIFGIAFAALVVALSALARRMPIPTPILQLVAGLALGLAPGIATPELDPDLVFFVFLPPILWSAAMFTSPREFRRNIGNIGLLAVGLVLVTTAVVAMAAHALLPGMPWAVAVALGAIVSPPDAVAATAIVSRLPVPRRVLPLTRSRVRFLTQDRAYDGSRAREDLGFVARIGLDEGLRRTVGWYREQGLL